MCWFAWFDVAMLATYLVAERWHARWLPWWRRYMSSGLLALKLTFWVLGLGWVGGISRFVVGMIAAGVFQWNVHTAIRNRRNGKDHRKLEAAARLTEVQQVALKREVAHAA